MEWKPLQGKRPPGKRSLGRGLLATWVVAILLLSGPVTVQAAPRRVPLAAPATEVAFRIYGLGLLPIDARFARFEGWLSYEPGNGGSCQVELAAEVASLIADDAAVRDMILGPDFMDAASFPTLRYAGRCDPSGELVGTLAMRGVTRPFSLAVTWTADRVVAEGRLLRAEWGMTALPLLGGRTVRIRVSAPLAAQASHGG